jgi:hypothetical protein
MTKTKPNKTRPTTPRKAGGMTPAKGRGPRMTDADWEKMLYLERIEKAALANGPRGSKLVKAFALNRALANLEEEQRDATQLRAAQDAALAEWSKLTPREQERIGWGWPDRGQQPSVAEWAREQAQYMGETDWGVRLTPAPDRIQVDCSAGWELFHGTEPVTLMIRPGTQRAQVVRAARRLVEALERYWSGIITMGPESRLLRLPTGEPAAAAEGMIPPGTLVEDASQDQCGIVVGGFRGANGILYVYIKPDGVLDSQYGMGLKVAKGGVGGIPAVTDIQGIDPLARMRGAAA